MSDVTGQPLPLTEKEVEVIYMMSNGMTDAQISHALHLARSTVKTYSTRARTKLGAYNRAQLVAIALRLKLIP